MIESRKEYIFEAYSYFLSLKNVLASYLFWLNTLILLSKLSLFLYYNLLTKI